MAIQDAKAMINSTMFVGLESHRQLMVHGMRG